MQAKPERQTPINAGAYASYNVMMKYIKKNIKNTIVLACTSLVVFMLLHTQILFVPSSGIKLNKCTRQ